MKERFWLQNVGVTDSWRSPGRVKDLEATTLSAEPNIRFEIRNAVRVAARFKS